MGFPWDTVPAWWIHNQQSVENMYFFQRDCGKNRWGTGSLIMKPVLGHPAATWMIPENVNNSRKGGS